MRKRGLFFLDIVGIYGCLMAKLFYVVIFCIVVCLNIVVLKEELDDFFYVLEIVF